MKISAYGVLTFRTRHKQVGQGALLPWPVFILAGIGIHQEEASFLARSGGGILAGDPSQVSKAECLLKF